MLLSLLSLFCTGADRATCITDCTAETGDCKFFGRSLVRLNKISHIIFKIPSYYDCSKIEGTEVRKVFCGESAGL